jgi:hypothetical protein
MRKLNHIGIPTREVQSDEIYMKEIKLHVTDFATSPNKIEWLRFEEGSPMPELLQQVTHIAYEVDDLEAELASAEILVEPFQAKPDLTCAFIVEEGAPIELMKFSK